MAGLVLHGAGLITSVPFDRNELLAAQLGTTRSVLFECRRWERCHLGFFLNGTFRCPTLLQELMDGYQFFVREVR